MQARPPLRPPEKGLKNCSCFLKVKPKPMEFPRRPRGRNGGVKSDSAIHISSWRMEVTWTEMKRLEKSRSWKVDQEFSFEHVGCGASIRHLQEMSGRQLNNRVWREVWPASMYLAVLSWWSLKPGSGHQGSEWEQWDNPGGGGEEEEYLLMKKYDFFAA